MKVINRVEAKAQGLDRYYTGKPCKRNHIGERYLDGKCVACNHLKNTSTDPEYKRKRCEQVKRYRDQYPDMVQKWKESRTNRERLAREKNSENKGLR